MKKMYAAIGIGVIIIAGLIAGLILMVSKLKTTCRCYIQY